MAEYISREAAIAYIREQAEECQEAFEELGEKAKFMQTPITIWQRTFTEFQPRTLRRWCGVRTASMTGRIISYANTGVPDVSEAQR